MANERIEVRLPDRMTVHAPKTDALIDSLVVAFSSLSTMLQASLVEIATTLQTLKGLPAQIDGLQSEMQHQFGLQLRTHLEAQVQMRLAAILSAGKQQAALLELKAERAALLPQDVDRLTARTIRLISEAASETTRHVRQLDSHVLDILEQVYPRQIQERFSVDSAEAFDILAAHASHAMTARAGAIDAALSDAKSALDQVVTLADSANAALEPFDWGDRVATGWHEATFLVVEVEDTETGGVEQRVSLVGGPRIDPGLETAARTMAARVVPASPGSLVAADAVAAVAALLDAQGYSATVDLDALRAARIPFVTD